MWPIWNSVRRWLVLPTATAILTVITPAAAAQPARNNSDTELSSEAGSVDTQLGIEQLGQTIEPLTLTLFATRIGLVGNHTANGHIVAERDHFVALPSRRGLNRSDNRQEFQVELCYNPTARCETAPVFDVGPWNETDDYWNPAHIRENWQDLPHGMPQAQAARETGYNSGKDGFGRDVRNAAGIDLADGTYWDGLALPTNDWISVKFLFTGGTVAVVRTDGSALNVRVAPDTGWAISRMVAVDSMVVLNCATTGTYVSGTVQATDRWYRLSGGGYISGAYVDTGGAAPPGC